MVQVGTLAQPTLNNTVGALFLGLVVAALLFGINIFQSYSYLHQFPHDPRLQRISVFILCLLDTFHLCLAIRSVYAYNITGFGDLFGLLVIIWSIKLQVLVNVVVILIVQCLYTMRVWLLAGYHRGVLGYIAVLVVATGFAVGIMLSSLLYTIDTYAELSKISWAINAALSVSTLIDSVIAAAMCYYLGKSKGQKIELNSRISTIIQCILGSGLLTSACSLSTLFSYNLLPKTFIFLALQFLMTKLYVGSYLAMLNARERPSNEGGSFGGTVSLERWRGKGGHTTSSFWSPQPLSTVTTGMQAFSTSEVDSWQKPDEQC